MPIAGWEHSEGRCSVCWEVSHTIRAYQCPSARKTRCTVLGVPSIGRCILSLRDLPIFLGIMRCFVSSCTYTSLPYCLNWIECHRLGCLKRGKPIPGIVCCLATRKRLRDFESRSATI